MTLKNTDIYRVMLSSHKPLFESQITPLTTRGTPPYLKRVPGDCSPHHFNLTLSLGAGGPML